MSLPSTPTLPLPRRGGGIVGVHLYFVALSMISLQIARILGRERTSSSSEKKIFSPGCIKNTWLMPWVGTSTRRLGVPKLLEKTVWPSLLKSQLTKTLAALGWAKLAGTATAPAAGPTKMPSLL